MTATRIEFQAVARALQSPHPVSRYGYRALESHDQALNVLLIQSGIGPEKARIGAQQLLDRVPWDVIISTGFAGALDAVPIGAVLIGHEVLSEPSTTSPVTPPSQPIACHPDWVNMVSGMAWPGQKSLHSGRYVSVGHVLTHSVDKHTLKACTGAVGVDMESAAIGEIAQGHGLPFLIVRAISDGVNENLPVDFNLFLRPSGWVSGVMHIMTTPSSWKGFLDLYRHSKEASQQLTQFFREFFSVVASMPILPISQGTKL